jgi:hypothetical protein
MNRSDQILQQWQNFRWQSAKASQPEVLSISEGVGSGIFSCDSPPSQNWVRMIVGRTKPEIYALHLYQTEMEGFHLYRVWLLEGETPPNSNVLFPVVFENKASTPLHCTLCGCTCSSSANGAGWTCRLKSQIVVKWSIWMAGPCKSLCSQG